MTMTSSLAASVPIEPSPNAITDPRDGLPVMRVGPWAFEKHQLLQDYVAASYGVRMRNAQSTLIDLYCGPGRVFNKNDATDIRDNGVITAYKKSLEGKKPHGKYRTVIIGDADKNSLEACKTRLTELGANVIALHGPSNETVTEAVARCPPYGLKLAYLDPFRPEDLPFSVLNKLSKLRMIDFIVYYGQMDITRNIDSEYHKEISRFDQFAPGWKGEIEVDSMKQENARAQFLEYWLSLMQTLGFEHARTKPLMTLDKNNAPLYRMILFSSHALAAKLWNSVAQSPQSSFDF